jgi:UDP-glucose 4-epimerase
LVQYLSARFEGRIIYASSGAVYGDKSSSPYGIDAPVTSVDTYSTTKIRAEELVLSAGGTVVRLANLFGHGMSQGNVLSDIFRQAPGNGPLFVRDDTPVRDFLSVDDAATIFSLLTRSRLPGIVNAGSGVGISIRELALMALALSGGSGRTILATHPKLDLSINILDISKTVEALNWMPSLLIENFMSEFFRKT